MDDELDALLLDELLELGPGAIDELEPPPGAMVEELELGPTGGAAERLELLGSGVDDELLGTGRPAELLGPRTAPTPLDELDSMGPSRLDELLSTGPGGKGIPSGGGSSASGGHGAASTGGQQPACGGYGGYGGKGAYGGYGG